MSFLRLFRGKSGRNAVDSMITEPPTSSKELARYVDCSELRELTEGADVALVKASYFLKLNAAGKRLPRRQDLPAEALVDAMMSSRIFSEIEFVSASNFAFNMQFPGLVIVSYAWGSRDHPDEHGNLLREVLAPAIEWYMSERAALVRDKEFWAATLDGSLDLADQVDFGIFVDYCSMHQRPRDEALGEVESFKRALHQMDLLYGHQLTVKWRCTRRLATTTTAPTTANSSTGTTTTTTTTTTTALPYSQRGWPYFETQVSHLISLAPHVLDLGRVDWSAPIPYDLHEWRGTSNVVTGSATAHFRGVSKPFAELASQGSYVNAGSPAFFGQVQDRRRPPTLPADFSSASGVRSKHFTNGADVDAVISLHVRVATAVLEGVRDLTLNHFGWSPSDGAALAAALRHTRRVRHLDLGFNQLADRGVTALAAAAKSGTLSQLAMLKLHVNNVSDAGCADLASAMHAGCLPAIQTLYLHLNAIGDQGVSAIARAMAARRTPALESLTLSRNQIASAGLKALASSIPHLPKLSQLRLEAQLHRPEKPSQPGLVAMESACVARQKSRPFDTLKLPDGAEDRVLTSVSEREPSEDRRGNRRRSSLVVQGGGDGGGRGGGQRKKSTMSSAGKLSGKVNSLHSLSRQDSESLDSLGDPNKSLYFQQGGDGGSGGSGSGFGSLTDMLGFLQGGNAAAGASEGRQQPQQRQQQQQQQEIGGAFWEVGASGLLGLDPIGSDDDEEEVQEVTRPAGGAGGQMRRQEQDWVDALGDAARGADSHPAQMTV